MLGLRLTHAAIATAATLVSTVLAQTTVDPIVIKGSKFFYKTNGTEFFIKGVAYQQDVGGNGTSGTNVNFIDPLTDSAGCSRDIPYLQKLQTNTVRVYAIDPTQDHTQCMQMLAAAGIYVIADLSAPNASINRIDPAWTTDLYARYTSVVDVLAPFTNTLGFFAGNEVSNNASNIDAIPFVKAAVRDTKAYIAARNYRTIGVGYAADDDPAIRAPLEDYLNCGPAEDAIDFFGYNIYSWCGQSSFQASGYADRTAEFSNYSVPAFFAEYGCNVPEPRLFDETLALYSSNMTGVWSGGIVYEYFQETNGFGLISLDGNSVSALPDFTALSTQIAKVTPTGANMASYTPTNTVARACPATNAAWDAVASPLPVTPNEQLCSCMVQNLTCVAKSGVSDSAIGSLFAGICNPLLNGPNICAGIAANSTTGDYGAYGMCSAVEQLSWAMNSYFFEQQAQNSANTDACDFGGNATTQTPSLPTTCTALASQAGQAGTGVVTSAPTGTGSSGGSGSGGGASTTTSSAAGAAIVPSFDFGLLKLGVYVSVAAMVGGGIVLM
ncbi:1,3-beta-glucanosyltransferase gas1 [Xylographa vitiligo]|nr:1,3-beta-glucanosyltransferase gas1 [Xylographa vitiligo]